MKNRLIFSFILMSLALVPGIKLFAQTHKANDIVGIWYNEEKSSKVQIFSEGGKFYGKVVWLREPNDKTTGKPRVDNLNPDEKLRNTPLLSLVVLKSFVFNGKDEWSDGTIYDPKNGKKYSCYIQFESPTTLKIRGYIGVSLLGRTTHWTKAQ
jgi:uncharacterized protein (DUF2147 family)